MNKRQKRKSIDKLLAKAGKEMAEDASRLAQTNDDGSVNRLAEVLARRTNAYGQTEMIIRMDASIPEYLFDRLVDANGDLFGEFRLFDNRVITAQQRKFINALCRDIARYTGDTIDQVREHRFQSTHSRGVRHNRIFNDAQKLLFQSTHSRGVRLHR